MALFRLSGRIGSCIIITEPLENCLFMELRGVSRSVCMGVGIFCSAGHGDDRVDCRISSDWIGILLGHGWRRNRSRIPRSRECVEGGAGRVGGKLMTRGFLSR